MTEEQADRWIAITPSESQTHTHNANTHIHTLEHTHPNTHTHADTLFSPEWEGTDLYYSRMYNHYEHFYQ